MAKETLPVNFQDDIISDSMGGKRRYRLIQNTDGTYCLEDATTYDQVGSNFGAGQINATNTAVNASADAGKIIDDIDAIKAVTQEGYIAGALALKQVNSDLEDLKTYKVITLSTPLSAGSSVTIPELTDAREVVAYVGNQQFIVKQCEKGITARSATYNTWDGTNSTYYQVYHVTVDFSTGKVTFAGSKGASAGEMKVTKIYYR